MFKEPLDALRRYVNLFSGSLDREDVAALAQAVAEDFASLGFSTELIRRDVAAPVLRCVLGDGPRQLMLMGHLDTVFPRNQAVPFQMEPDGRARGSGISDMKGGIVVMLYALQRTIPLLDLQKIRLCVLINPDEEIGSPASRDLILETARRSFAALSFEPPVGEKRALVCGRKGVTSALIVCRGVPGHAGMEYKECASAVQGLCAQITRLYSLRDDQRDVSFNAGLISGGTAENVVAPEASCKCEFRYFQQEEQPRLMERIREICAQEPVPGVTTTVVFSDPHPAVDLSEKTRALLEHARAAAQQTGIPFSYERSGGAGDISIAAQAGIGVLDGLGLPGGGTHTAEEYGEVEELWPRIVFASKLIARVCGEA